MKKLIVLVGPPNCGKSTWISENIDDTYYIASRDNVIMELGNGLSYNKSYNAVDEKEVNRLFNERFDNAVKSYTNIVVDMMNLSPKRRKGFISRVGKKYTKEAIVFKFNVDELFKRNIERNLSTDKYIKESVILEMISKYTEPTLDEGFDNITYIDNGCN